MAQIEYYGIHIPLIREYVEYKRTLGFKMVAEERILNSLSSYACDHEYHTIGFTKSFVDKWTSPKPMESPKSRMNRICCLRGFSYFLAMKGYETHIPKIPKCVSNFVPYIFSNTEMISIFKECDSIYLKRNSNKTIAHIMPCLIRLLYATGIRIGEALALTHKDIHLEAKYLFLKSTKNGQDRIVPISESLHKVICDYIDFKRKFGYDCNENAFLFINRNRQRCGFGRIRNLFGEILTKAGIQHQGRGKGPRIHDLRHTFCVRSLAKLSKEGLDMYCSMPILMTYVGHQSLASINKYIRATNENYPNLLTQLSAAYKGIFPSVGIDNDDYEEI